MSTADGAEQEPDEPSTSKKEKSMDEEKLRKLIARREALIKAKEKLENREVDFDNPDNEERKVKKEKLILKTLLELEKRLYEAGELADVNEDTKRLFDDNGQKDALVIEGTGHQLLDQRLTEALKRRLQEKEPSFVISCALYPQDLVDVCREVRQQELDSTGKTSIPLERTTTFDLLMAKMADLIKKAVIKYRYGDHNSLLNLFVTEEEAVELRDVQEASQPTDLPDLSQMTGDNEHIATEDSAVSTASSSNSGDSTDYDEVFEGGEDPEKEKSTDDEMEATSEPHDCTIQSETTETAECTVANDTLPQLPSSIISENGSSVEIQSVHNHKPACNYSEIVLSSGPASHNSVNDLNTSTFQSVPVKAHSIESSASGIVHENGGINNSQQKIDETGDEDDETGGEEEQPLKPDWLKGKTAAELVECFNARLKADDLQVVYATEYEEIEPRIEKHKMDRCEVWAGKIEGWVVEFPEAAEVEKLQEVKKDDSSPNSTSTTATNRNGKRTRPRSERILEREREEAEREVKRMKPVDFVATAEIITID